MKYDQGVSPALTPATRNGNFLLNHAPNSGRKWQDLDRFSATDVGRNWPPESGALPWPPSASDTRLELDVESTLTPPRFLDPKTTSARSSQVGKTHDTPVAEICGLCHGVKKGHAEP